jgi:hypothetical protein
MISGFRRKAGRDRLPPKLLGSKDCGNQRARQPTIAPDFRRSLVVRHTMARVAATFLQVPEAVRKSSIYATPTAL